MNAEQEEEIEALRAIYDEDFCRSGGDKTSYSILIHTDDNSLSAELKVTLPLDYPTQSPPVHELKNASWLEKGENQYIAENLQSIFKENGGEVVVYQWVEWIREYMSRKMERIKGVSSNEVLLSNVDTLHDTNENEDGFFSTVKTMKTVEPSSPSIQDGGSSLEIIHGEPLTDRKSTFQAHIAHVNSVDEVKCMLSQLKSNKKIAAATHNILAYRIYVSSRNVFQQDCDDDGEAAAGGRLLHLLQIMDAQNVAVVVTRWYGGILLHSDRFKHINNVARIAIQESGIGLEHLAVAEKPVKSKNKKRTKSKT